MKIKLVFRKITKIVLSFTAVMLLAVGCGGGGGGQASTIRIWSVFDDPADFQPLLQYYKKKRPNTRVVFEQKSLDTYEEDLINALASGQGPDVFLVHNSWVPKYLDKVVEAPDTVWNYSDFTKTFVDAVTADFTRNRKVYGMSAYVDSLALYYNKDILGSSGIATPAKTWAELEADSREITRLNSNGYFSRSGVAMGLSSLSPGGQINRAEDILYLLMLQRGVNIWSEDGLTPTFASGGSEQISVEALKYYSSFSDGSNQNYTWNTQSDYSIDAFANSRVAYMLNYSYARDLIDQKASNLNYDVARAPQLGLDGTEVNYASYWGYVVSKQSKNQKVAWELLKIISDKEALDSYSAVTRLPSSRRDLIELQIKDPDIGIFAHGNLTAKTFHRPDQQKFDAVISNLIDDVTLRNFDEREAISKASRQASEIPKGK